MSSEASVLPGVQYAGPSTYWPERVYYGLTGRAWLRVGIIAILMGGLFWPNLRRLWLKTNPFYGEANWGHAIFVPLIGAYYLYLNRDSLAKAKVRPAWSGLTIMLAGLVIYAWAIWPGQNDFIKDLSMVVTLLGVATVLCGWEVMRIAWFAIIFLAAAIPWPGLMYSQVAMPLQRLAAGVAVHALRLGGIEAINEGTRLAIGSGQTPRMLNVAEACAGIKSLMTFVTVGAAVGFLSNRRLWQKVLITLSAVPIAIFCNVMRVAGQGFLDLWDSRLSESFAHQFVGLIMLIPAFFLILLVAWIVDNLFIEEVDRRALAEKKRQRRQSLVIEVPRVGAGGAAAQTPAAAPVAAASTVSGASASPQAGKGNEDELAAATRRMMAASANRPRRPRAGSSSLAGGAGSLGSTKEGGES